MNVPPNTSRGITTVFTIFRRLVKNHRKAQWDFWDFVSDKEKTTFYNIICSKFMLSKWITRNQKLVGTTSCVTVGSDKAMTGCLIILFISIFCVSTNHSLSILISNNQTVYLDCFNRNTIIVIFIILMKILVQHCALIIAFFFFLPQILGWHR